MERKFAEQLVSELEGRKLFPGLDIVGLTGLLGGMDVQPSSRFYECIPENEQLFKEKVNYHRLSLRRILRNNNAGEYQIPTWKKCLDSFASALGVYSSDALSRNLRVEAGLMEMMAKSEHPFSLIGKVKTYDWNNPEERLFIITKPLLIIPGATNQRAIEEWESRNRDYKEEVGTFLRHTRPISRRDYLLR